MVTTNWREGVLGSVTHLQILPAPTFVFIGLFVIVESYPVDPPSNQSRGNSSSNSGTFLKFTTLKMLPRPPDVSQIFNCKTVAMSSSNFITLQIDRHLHPLFFFFFFFFFGGGGGIVRVRVKIRV